MTPMNGLAINASALDGAMPAKLSLSILPSTAAGLKCAPLIYLACRLSPNGLQSGLKLRQVACQLRRQTEAVQVVASDGLSLVGLTPMCFMRLRYRTP
jgi:hypothetical protein